MEKLDFHVHSFVPDSVFNLIIGRDIIPPAGYFTAGIHPWFTQDPDQEKRLLEETAVHPKCIAVGECGLDRLKGPDLEYQKDLFEYQISLAQRLSKPLIVHCVKAHNELLEIKKKTRTTIPWIIHGFNQNETIARRLFECDFYFSIGKPVIHETSNCSKVLSFLPVERLFLETDSADVTIEQVYEAACERLRLPMTELVDNLQANFRRIFTLHE